MNGKTQIELIAPEANSLDDTMTLHAVKLARRNGSGLFAVQFMKETL